MFCHPALASLSFLCDWARAQSPPTHTQSNTASLCLFWPLRPVHLARPAPTQTTSRELQCGGARSTSSWRPSPWHMPPYVPSLRCSPSSKKTVVTRCCLWVFLSPCICSFPWHSHLARFPRWMSPLWRPSEPALWESLIKFSAFAL